jgi:hypothetical protein
VRRCAGEGLPGRQAVPSGRTARASGSVPAVRRAIDARIRSDEAPRHLLGLLQLVWGGMALLAASLLLESARRRCTVADPFTATFTAALFVVFAGGSRSAAGPTGWAAPSASGGPRAAVVVRAAPSEPPSRSTRTVLPTTRGRFILPRFTLKTSGLDNSRGTELSRVGFVTGAV